MPASPNFGVSNIQRIRALTNKLEDSNTWDTFGDILISISSDGEVMQVNDAIIQMLDIPKQDMIGRQISTLVYGCDRDNLKSILSYMSNNSTSKFKARLVDADTNPIDAEWVVRRLEDKFFASVRPLEQSNLECSVQITTSSGN